MKAIYYKKQGVIELIDKKHIADFIIDGQDEWFQAKIGNKYYMFNFINNTLGMFEAIKDKNTYSVGEFLSPVEVEINEQI